MSAISALMKKTTCHAVNVQRVLRAQSAFKVFFVLAFAILFEGGLWLLFLDGFRFLDHLGGVGLMIVGRLFSLFFLGMGAMLVVSSIVTSYSTIFRSGEIPFLVVRPFRVDQIVAYKFLESTGLSSWAFFFIVVPFVGAYAWHEQLPVLFSLWTLLFSVPFLVICSGIGTAAALVFVRWFPSHRLLKLLIAAAAGTLIVVGWWMLRDTTSGPTGPTFNLAALVPGLKLASHPLLPNWWISEGIMALARGHWQRGLLLWGLCASTAAVVLISIEQLGRLVFYEAWQRVLGSNRNSDRAAVLMPGLEKITSCLPRNAAAMILKDVRTFLRDPMQWSQVLIFFGLLAIYFINLRTFRYHLLPDRWRNTIAFLNVFSVSAVMCSLGSRFVYPQLSLEGQGFWILGLSPISKRRIVMTKFFLSFAGMLAVSAGLMVVSTAMLEASAAARAAAVGLACAVSCAVCGLSTGLGAVFLDLDQRNPAAIVSGFGGTLNLVLSLGFMLLAILPFGLAFHAHISGHLTTPLLHRALGVCGAWLIAITLLTTILPLILGVKSLRNRDF